MRWKQYVNLGFVLGAIKGYILTVYVLGCAATNYFGSATIQEVGHTVSQGFTNTLLQVGLVPAKLIVGLFREPSLALLASMTLYGFVGGWIHNKYWKK